MARILGTVYGARGTYNLSGGELNVGTGEYIGLAGTAVFNQSGGTHVTLSLTIGINSGSSGAYNLTGGALLSASNEYIGIFYSNGTFTQSGGTNSVANLVLGQYIDSSGTYSLNGGLLSLSGSGLVQGGRCAVFEFGGGTLGATTPWSSSVPMTLTGNGGDATIDTTGGNIALSGVLSGSGGLTKVGPNTLTLSAANTFSGNLIVNGGNLAMPGGSLGATRQYIGYSSTGSFVQSGGANSVSTELNIGFSNSGSGAYTLSGGCLIVPGNFNVGNAGIGSFVQTGGVAAVSGSGGLVVGVGQSSQGTGSYLLGGGTLAATSEYVGNYNGVGAFIQSGGNNSAAAEVVGAGGIGSYVQTGGTNSASAGLTIGQADSGAYSLSGSGVTTTTSLAIGVWGSGSFAQSGGTNALGSLYVVITPTGTGAYNLSGAGLLTATEEFIGYNGPASFIQSGGTNSVSSLAMAQNAGSTGTYNLTGGLLAANQILVGAGNGVLNFSGGTIVIGGLTSVTVPIVLNNPFGTGTLNVAGSSSSVTISGPISGPGSLTKVGAGMLVLTGNESFTGTLQASAGTVQLSGAGAVLGPGSIRASAGAVVQYSSALIQGGFLRGPGTHTTLPGTSNYFNGAQTYATTVFLQNGTDTFINFTNGGQVTNNAALVWDGGENNVGGTLTVNSTVSTDDFINVGVIKINGGGAINNHLSDMSGGGRITINSGGTLNADSQNEGTALGLQNSLLVNDGTVVGTTNVYYGATAQGSGTFGLINVYEGGMLLISPSSSPVAPAAVVSGGSVAGEGLSAIRVDTDGAYVVAPNMTDRLTLSGDIGGSGSITKLGAGTLVLSGSNTYEGGTIVLDGTLIATNSEALPDGSNLMVGNAGAFAPVIPNDSTVSLVPEPGTLALLAAAACGPAVYRRLLSRRKMQ